MKEVEQTAASITVHRFSEMTPRGKREVLAWLRSIIDHLEQNPRAFAKRYTARYLYRTFTKK